MEKIDNDGDVFDDDDDDDDDYNDDVDRDNAEEVGGENDRP